MNAKDTIDTNTLSAVSGLETYKHGWQTDVDMDFAPKGLDETVVRLISGKNDEPEWMTTWRLDALKTREKRKEPDWAMITFSKIDFQDQYYYTQLKSFASRPGSLDPKAKNSRNHTQCDSLLIGDTCGAIPCLISR